MGLPAGYGFRAPTLDDLDTVAAVLIADDLDDAGEVVLDAHFVREVWGRADVDLKRDAWVVVDRTEAIVGYGHVTREEPDIIESWGVVHPDRRGRGIGSALLDRIEGRTAELLVGPRYRRFHHAVNTGDAAAAAMLGSRGLRPVRHFWHMGIDLVEPVEARTTAHGFEIRAVERREDLVAVHAVLDAAFADDWGYHPEPFDRWAEDHASSPSFDPTLWLLARADGDPVGALTANVLGDRGWIGELGVLASERRRGLGATLLRRSFATFAGRGLGRVMLNVDADNPTGATALYERVGMRVVKRWTLWERSPDTVGGSAAIDRTEDPSIGPST